MSLSNLPPFNGSDSIPKNPLEITSNRGGINCKIVDDPGFIQIASSFLKKISGKILGGKFNFSSMQRPTIVSNPISHLQLLASEYVLAFEYFSKAAQVTNDIDRLKLIIAGVVGNMSYNIYGSQGRGPVNPTLGETLTVK